MVKPERENRQQQQQREITKKQVISFKKRKACILKKTMELAVLCDVQACAIIVDDDGEVITWPEDRGEAMKVLERYRGAVPTSSSSSVGGDPRNYNKEMSDDPVLLKKSDCGGFQDLLKKSWEEILNDIDNNDNNNNNNNCNYNNYNYNYSNCDFSDTVEHYESLLQDVDAKLKSVMQRIELLKSEEEGRPECLLEYYEEQDCSCSSSSSSYNTVQVPIASTDISDLIIPTLMSFDDILEYVNHFGEF